MITIAVCAKPAWRTDVALRLGDSGKSVRPDGAQPGWSATDAGALAKALDLKTALRKTQADVRVLVVSVGPASADMLLRDALAAGADDVLRLWPSSWSDAGPADLDGSAAMTRTKALLVAESLRAAVNSGDLLVLTGDASPDEGHAVSGAFIACALELDFAHRVTRMEPEDSGWSTVVRLDRGYGQALKLARSAVVTLSNTGRRLPDAPWPAWLASRTAVVPLDMREPQGSATRSDHTSTALRAPIPRVKAFPVPSSALPAEVRIKALLGGSLQKGGAVIPANEGTARQVDAIVELLKDRGYLIKAP